MTNNINKVNLSSIDSLEFEDAPREKKGASTEDSGLKILGDLAKKHKFGIHIVERVAPSGVGEFDAICCTDSVLIVVELKRYGGNFAFFNLFDEKICIQTGRTNKWIPNPVVKLQQKAERMKKDLIDNDAAWVPVKRLYSGHVPIYKVICFGPSTSFDTLPEADRNTCICTTRTLARTIEEIYASRVGVVGAGQQMATLVSIWPRWGILTTHKKGFLRCALSKISTSKWDLSPYGIEALNSDGKQLEYQFNNGRKGKLPFDENVLIKSYVNGKEKTASITPLMRFRWRIKGK